MLPVHTFNSILLEVTCYLRMYRMMVEDLRAYRDEDIARIDAGRHVPVSSLIV